MTKVYLRLMLFSAIFVSLTLASPSYAPAEEDSAPIEEITEDPAGSEAAPPAEEDSPQEVAPPPEAPVPAEEEEPRGQQDLIPNKPKTSADFKALDREEVLPDIEAKSYTISVQRRSRSLRVYLFRQEKVAQGQPEGLPAVGKILLLTKGNEFVMGFRVLKTYPDRVEFAASKVRIYDKYTDLEVGDSLDAAEKVADIMVPEYTLKDQELDRQDLREIEAGMKPVPVPVYDPELDAGTSPPPNDDPRRIRRKLRKLEEEDDDGDVEIGDEEIEAIAPDEIKPFDTDYHWLSAGLSMIRTPKPDGSSTYYTGGGLRYGITAGKQVFARSSHGQDSFVYEFGLLYYTIIGYEGDADSWTVMPLSATLRYNLMFSEGFGSFLYAGLFKNFVLSSSTDSETGTAALGGIQPAFGAGMLWRLGPKWFMRADLGIDMIGAALVLRF